MLEIRSLLSFCDSRHLIRVFSLLLSVSLLLLLDILLIIEASRLWGSYLVMAVIAGAGLLLLALAMNTVSRLNNQLRRKIRKGTYPGREFAGIGGVIVAAVLFLYPGAVTNLLGLLLLLPPFRQIIGRLVIRSQQQKLQETYEYLKMQEFSHSM
ncbi:FxsA family protein [Spirochaeta africana]|uniref:Protein affecting phage T7 exclusion by the F plasmid n=1 Tax=Spirochaeta africana (strain ATCC 700263 / DSM 8902 / Z-7692) TaxID=889378 RepID=H9UMQ6_SPIAZ|nr:FxsA family protein [Spirochaeta africana]AFG38799.1 protein affecting phage T7 exclusion by the F plasmid [Spirochaeta africana DSM 8902]